MESKPSAEYRDKVDVEQSIANISGDHEARKAERALLLKIDFMVVPTVTLLYLMCFVDRTNIGMLCTQVF